MSQEQKIRLQKILADCGVASRRKAEELIAQKQVKVNGRVAQVGDKADPKRDHITVAGQKIETSNRQKHYYILLHKPRGYVSTMSDERGRKCVAELVEDVPARVYPVGRLDRESEGLLLMTNDGNFANTISHPSRHVSKTYRVTVRPSITEEQLVQFQVGMEIDGKKTAPADVRVISQEPNRVVLEIVLHEGRNRQIRKMCEQVGLEVARLRRTAIGPVKLGMVQQGQWRELTNEEVKRLMASAKPAARRR